MTPGDVDLAGSDTERNAGDRAAIPQVVAAMHGFAGDLYGELPTDGNLVVSPYSVVAALGMVLTGADGRTAREMRDVLGAGERFHGGEDAEQRDADRAAWLQEQDGWTLVFFWKDDLYGADAHPEGMLTSGLRLARSRLGAWRPQGHFL